MTREEKGAYMELLQAQHSRGSVPLAWIKRLFGDDFERLWAILKEKFKRDEDGFFNVRLREEIEKRRAYSESRKANRIKKKIDTENVNASESETVQITYDNHMSNISKSYDEHMGIGIGINNNSTTEDSNSSSVAITRKQGGAGGNGNGIERPTPEFHAALYLRFTAAYGGTGRNPKRTSIEYALLAAMDDCMASIKADAEIRGVKFSAHELQMAAASFLCSQAHACLQQDTAHRNKRMNPETWLSEKCYQSHVGANAPPPTEKETPSQKMKRELEAFKIKHQAEREAQNGSK